MDRYIGKVLDDRYEIISAIGVGGMAYVYKARCRRLSRFVAIKILKQEFANDTEFKRRFKNESNAVARLSHKNIVNIFDVSNTEEVNYIVMELIEGITLKEYLIKKDHLDWKQTLFFSSQIAEALEHAHSRGIIHQDIKPQNIMLLRDGTLKVADFGIAKLENEGETKVIKEAIGSVHYVSPEQAKGNTIDTRTDLYSLGVVMYEMATGRTPYKGDTAISIVMQHINSLPAPPTSLNEEMPKSLEYVILKAMNPSLKNRYKTAGELIADIEKIKSNPHVIIEEEDSILDGLNKTQVIGKEDLKIALAKSRTDKFQRIVDEEEEEYVKPAPKPKKTKTKAKKVVAEYDDDDDDDDDDYDYEPRKNGLIIFLAMIVVLVIVWYAGQFMFNKVFIEEIPVSYAPSVVDMAYEDVMADEKYDEYSFVISEQIYSDDPAGTIIKQNPEAYVELALEGSVYLTLSLGPKTDAMPNLIEYDYNLAQIELGKLGITNIELEYDYDEEVEEGKVYKTSPVAYEDITANTAVTLYVSAGKELVLTKVPTLKGLTLEQAELNLEIAGLVLGEVTNEISESTEGTIIAQGVQSGTEVLTETVINVVIAEAAPVPVISQQTITVTIPQDSEYIYQLMEVYVDNTLAYSKEHSQFEGRFDVTIEGSGSAVVTIYSNGIMFDERVVTFN
ncbi:MAG: Stk1 family PASTA domain-containing Ser/Thr kinase [Clostridia bacterium]